MKKVILSIAAACLAVSVANAGTDYNLVVKATDMLIDKVDRLDANYEKMHREMEGFRSMTNTTSSTSGKFESKTSEQLVSIEKQILEVRRSSSPQKIEILEKSVSMLTKENQEMAKKMALLEKKFNALTASNLASKEGEINAQESRLRRFVETAESKGAVMKRDFSEPSTDGTKSVPGSSGATSGGTSSAEKVNSAGEFVDVVVVDEEPMLNKK